MAAQESENVTSFIGAGDVGRHTKRQPRLVMKAWSCVLPKENPRMPLGQDSFFISASKQTIGVADGLGGVAWADSGKYARRLMFEALRFIKKHPKKTVDPVAALQAAFEYSDAFGCSTACIITLKHNSLHAVNIGDSGFRVIRGEKTVYKSPVQQQSFNCPFHLARRPSESHRRSKYQPSHADRIVVGVERGDVLVAGTDGLFDNLFDGEIEEIVKATVREGKPTESIAGRLGRIAQAKSLIRDCVTPFSVAAAAHGHSHAGGKYDDVSVVVARIY